MTDAPPRHPEGSEGFTLVARGVNELPHDVEGSAMARPAPDDGAADQVHIHGDGLDRNVGARHEEQSPMPGLLATRVVTAPIVNDLERVSPP